MNDLFQICVNIIKYLAKTCDTTYEAMNIYLFVIIHPLITLCFLFLFVWYRKKYKRLLGGQL